MFFEVHYMDTIDNSKDIEKELTRIYDRFNHHFWNDELPDVMITFKPTKGALGHMSSIPTWISDTNNDKYELNVSAYTINKKPQEICEIILHEQCHLYNAIHKIKDCSNAGRYHNTKFRITAERHGLLCGRTNWGWSSTHLTKEALKYIKRLNIKQFEYHYNKHLSERSTLMRYSCPICNKTTAWLSKDQLILCGSCNEPMVFSPAKK